MIDVTVSTVISAKIRPLLEQCLESLFKNTFKAKLEIFVVDNLSKDDSVAMVRERFPQVKIIRNKECLGFAANNNQIIKKGKGRYFVLLNPDTIVKPYTLDLLVEFMDNHPEAGVVGPIFFFPDGSLQSLGRSFPGFKDFLVLLLLRNIITGRITRSISLKRRKIAQRKKRTEPYEIDWPLGAGMMVRYKTIDDVGMMDPSYILYAEETDWCKRIKNKGWKIYCVPEAKIVHYTEQESKQMGNKATILWYESHFRYFKKHCSKLSLASIKLLVFLDMLYQIIAIRIKKILKIESQKETQKKLNLYKYILKLSLSFIRFKSKVKANPR